MTDAELLGRITAIRIELSALATEAKRNAKYATGGTLARMSYELTMIEAALAWHVGIRPPDDAQGG